MDLRVAGLPIRVESADATYFNRRFADYARTDGAAPVMTMCTRVQEHIPQPEGEILQKVKYATVLRQPDGYLCRYIRHPHTGELLFTIRYLPDYSDVEITLSPARATPDISLRDWEYMYTGAMFRNRLFVLDGGVLHSSSLAWRGQGVAFSADSGTGKSTHVSLWKACFGEDVTVINDDKPAIFYEDGRPILCGTPWSGKTDLNCNRHVPLRAIVFIERGKQNSIRRLDTMDSMYCLLGQLARPFYDEELGVRTIDFAQRLCETLPIYCLTCDISREAVKTAFHGVFSQEAFSL